MNYPYPSQETIYHMPLQSWDVLSLSISELVKRSVEESSYLLSLGDSKEWDMSVELLEAIKDNVKKAIVLTDASQSIVWVNNNFINLTGYQSSELLGRNPRFLQGKKQNQAAAHNIKKDLSKAKPTSQNVLNYRKSGDAYLCCVKIYPLFNKQQELVNYIAFENEIKPDAA